MHSPISDILKVNCLIVALDFICCPEEIISVKIVNPLIVFKPSLFHSYFDQINFFSSVRVWIDNRNQLDYDQVVSHYHLADVLYQFGNVFVKLLDFVFFVMEPLDSSFVILCLLDPDQNRSPFGVQKRADTL